MKQETIWPRDTTVPKSLQRKIDTAARRLAQLCYLADIDLRYVDADSLYVKVDLPKKKQRKRL